MKTSRRKFLKKSAAGAAALSVSGSVIGLSAKDYRRISGANDRVRVAVQGLGRRFPAYVQPIMDTSNNVDLMYLCDVMDSQLDRALNEFKKAGDTSPKLEKDIRRILDDSDVDAVFMATPDHWHTPGACMAMTAGKHVYLEKPCSHNPWENELVVAYQKKYDKVVQMGNQQRSAPASIEIINEIHNGAIGNAYKAIAFYTNSRGEVPVPTPAPVPDGLDWELFQGPAPRKEYHHNTWDYNWHWYGWDYGTAEMGNNATHELDVARWALNVGVPYRVDVQAAKTNFPDDGWSMYDAMEATYQFEGDKVIKWDGQSRNGYSTYGTGRGTIVYGTNGSVYMDRGGYKLFDRGGKLVKDSKTQSNESGTALGGGGNMSTRHAVNFFETIRGKESLTSPIEVGATSQIMTHYANIAYRINEGFNVDPETRKIKNDKAMKLWSRDYENGWEPSV